MTASQALERRRERILEEIEARFGLARSEVVSAMYDLEGDPWMEARQTELAAIGKAMAAISD